MPWSEIFCKPRYENAKNQVPILISWRFMWNGTPVGCCMVASPFSRERGRVRVYPTITLAGLQPEEP
jgi:hypothetical protein